VAPRPEDVHPDVVGVDLHLHLFGLGQNGHRDGRGVDPALGLGDGDALDPVDAAFVLEAAVGPPALDHGDDLLEAAHARGGAGAEHLDAPARQLGEAGVHAEQVGGEQPRLVAARAGPDLEDDVLLVVRVFGKQQDRESLLELPDPRLERRDLLLGQFPEPLVALPQHLLGLVELAARLLVVPEGLDERRQIGVLLGQLLVLGAVGDHGGIAQQPLQLLVALFDVLDPLKHIASFCVTVPGDAGGAALQAACERMSAVAAPWGKRHPGRGGASGQGIAVMAFGSGP